MAYKALYRAYRPSTFDEVAGQQHIVQTLKNALATGKIAHAYLFAGPRGTGKTSMAKLFAKALNCEEGIGCQCNECKNCKAINDGGHPDVLELDAASNNGVDQIRELIERVKYGTILGKTKVYIIDEVHMLSPGAFNALLKTLEEPPEHVVFILATTEPHKILPTILSRCQRYDFTKLTDSEIKERIRVVLQREGIAFNEEAVDLIVSLADGGMRDALSILDQVLAYSGTNLNIEDILSMFALESKEEKIKLLTAIANHDVGNVLEKLNLYITKGTDVKRLTSDLLDILKDELIYQTSQKVDYLQFINKDDAIYLMDLYTKNQILSMIDILMTALKDYKNVASINPLFEITLLKLASLEENKNISFVKPEQIKENKIETKPIEKENTSINRPLPFEPKAEKKVEEIPEQVEEKPLVDIDENIVCLTKAEREDHFEIDDDLMMEIMVLSKKEIKADIINLWPNIKKYVAHPALGKYASLLVDCHPLVCNQKALILETPLQKMANNINLKETQKYLQNIINNIYNKKLFVYALPRNESVRLQQKFLSAKQIGKLPKATEINLEIKGE